MDGSENKYQNDMCSRASRLYVHNMIIIPSLRVNISGGLYSGIYGGPITTLQCPAGDGPRAFMLTRHHGYVCVYVIFSFCKVQ
jgi:hypothetical protein